MKEQWKKMDVKEKTVVMIRLLLSVLIIFLVLLQLMKITGSTLKYAEPLLGIYFLLSAFQEWSRNRRQGVISLCTGTFVLAVSVFIWFGR